MGIVKSTIRHFQFLRLHQISICLLMLSTILISYKEFYTYQNQQGGGRINLKNQQLDVKIGIRYANDENIS